MKKTVGLLLLLITHYSFSQETNVSVEKSIFGVQAGVLGIWVHNESRVSNAFALRSEAGINFGIIGGEIQGSTKLISAPNISLEPRWYYNLSKRENSGKNTKNNSGNFLTLGIKLFPKVEKPTYYIPNQISFIPKWGIKRSINHFTYETGIGIGKIVYLETVPDSFDKIALDLHLRIGYTF